MIRTVIDFFREQSFSEEDRHWTVDCFTGAMMAAIGWFTVENIWQFNQSGELFEPRGWSVTNLIVWVMVGVLVGAIAGWYGRTWRRRHEEGIRAVAAQLGFEYSANAEILRWLSGHLPMLRKWDYGKRLASGQRGSVKVQMFDLATVSPGNDFGESASSTTVVILSAEDLPDFDIGPRSFLMFGKWYGLRFNASDAITESDAATVAEFSHRCFVYCGWTKDDSGKSSLQPVPEAEQAVRNLLSPVVMRALIPLAEWWIESRAGWLALSRGRGFRPPSERANMIEQAIAIRSILMQSSHMTTARPIRRA